jgi:hypothetical protein
MVRTIVHRKESKGCHFLLQVFFRRFRFVIAFLIWGLSLRISVRGHAVKLVKRLFVNGHFAWRLLFIGQFARWHFAKWGLLWVVGDHSLELFSRRGFSPVVEVIKFDIVREGRLLNQFVQKLVVRLIGELQFPEVSRLSVFSDWLYLLLKHGLKFRQLRAQLVKGAIDLHVSNGFCSVFFRHI